MLLKSVRIFMLSLYYIPYLKAWVYAGTIIPAISSYLRHILMAGYIISSLAGF